MEETLKTGVLRRKGQPKKADVEPMVKKVLRCMMFWILFASLAVFLSMFWIWAMHNIRLVVSASKAIAQMSAEEVDRQAAGKVAEDVLRIRKDAPQGPTYGYTADEQVVLLGRYRDAEDTADWKALQEYFRGVSQKYDYADEFSLVFYDAETDMLIWLDSPKHPTGYCAGRYDVALPDENGYELSAFVGHREGTAVLTPVTATQDGAGLYVLCSFTFAGIMGTEIKKIAVPLLLGLLITVAALLRILWIFWQRRMQEELLQTEKEEETGNEEEAPAETDNTVK